MTSSPGSLITVTKSQEITAIRDCKIDKSLCWRHTGQKKDRHTGNICVSDKVSRKVSKNKQAEE